MAAPYRTVVGHLRSGHILADLPRSTTTEYTDTLNDTGSARATITIADVPPELDVLALLAPWRHYLAILRGTAVLWAGPIIPRRRAARSAVVEINASGLYAVLDRRLVARHGPWELTDPRADVHLTYRSLPGIALELLKIATERPDGDLPLVLSPVNTFGQHERRFYGYELGTVGQRLRQLSTVDGGPDVHFAPRLHRDGDRIEWAARIGEPHLNQRGQRWHFDAGAGLLAWGWDDDPSVMASRILVSGDGMERGRQIGAATDDTLTRAGWPVLDRVISDHGSVRERSTLDGHARAYLDAYSTGITAETLTVRADREPLPGSYLVGDVIAVTPRPDRITPAGTRTRRVLSITRRSAGPDVLDLTVAPVPSSL
ncbi:hypothetical protein NLX83_13705 [Allokutzneria sp. A3M-2-11 16]|uniref:hypothetical protein n=1 Tax=Allokutzneria sp. A3M-2-11 16 TaxID=2962043 RepID=UPI0020B8B4E6|nr:hypothetical protein [Allokutzneria sp. A3M-2-11 16]MCP3800314.1 hypothetical protein [Allokutzneria sp. A3M-2-11 16]